MSFIDLTKNHQWSEADIMAHGRAVIAAQCSLDRQQELQTIMLGHIAGLRTALPAELAEIATVQQVTEAQAVANDEARADMARLLAVMAYEAALERLTCAPITEPATIMEGEVEVPNPWIAHDAQERAEAQDLIDGASEDTLDLYALRHPAPPEEVTE